MRAPAPRPAFTTPLPLRVSSGPSRHAVCRRAPTSVAAPPLPPRAPSPRPPALPSIRTTEQFLHAMSVAADASVPAVVLFHAGYCRACAAVLPKAARLAGEYAGRAVFVSVKMEEAQGLGVRLGVRQVPWVQVYDGGLGKVEEFACGMASVGKFREVVEDIVGEREMREIRGVVGEEPAKEV